MRMEWGRWQLAHWATLALPFLSSIPWWLVQNLDSWSTGRAGLYFFMTAGLEWHLPQKRGMSVGPGFPTKPASGLMDRAMSSVFGSPPWQEWQERPAS